MRLKTDLRNLLYITTLKSLIRKFCTNTDLFDFKLYINSSLLVKQYDVFSIKYQANLKILL